MSILNEPHRDASGRELHITRMFNAPRALVFRVWTMPEHVAQWWGPRGFTITTQEMDARPGGVWRFTMHGPDGTDYPSRIAYKEVVEPERLVFLYDDDNGDDSGQFLVTVSFEEQGGQTQIDMRMAFRTKEALDLVIEQHGAVEGNKQTMDRLEQYLEQIG